jgi:hypothetical protein
MARNLPFKMMRPQTKPVQIQITVEHHTALSQMAKQKNVTVPTLMRLIIELSVASPEWAAKLFDDEFGDRETP